MKAKKIFLFDLCLVVLLALPYITQAQGIEMLSGGTIAVSGGATIELNNQGFVNNGSFTKGTETVTFSGTSPRTISGSSNTALYNLQVTNTGGVTSQIGLLTATNLAIEAGSRFTIDPTKYVTVNGTLTNSAGNSGLVIKSTALGTGSLIFTSGNVSATVERYIPAADWINWDDGWHFLSSPVATQSITPNFTTSPSGNYDFYSWYEPTNEWVNIKSTSGTSWAAANSSADFNVGKGYMAAYKDTDTKLFSGMLNASDVSVSGLTISSGVNKSWHLLGNPFTSALTWYTGWGTTNIGGVAYIWNEAGKGYSPVNAGEIIPSENGFMVHVNSGTGSLTIPEIMRVHSAQVWYKKSTYPVIRLIAHNPGNSSFQESQVRLNPESTAGFDFEYDGNFLPGYAPSFYSVMEGENLMVNSLPEFTTETVIPFSFVKNEGTNFSIEAKGIESLNSNDILYLKDKKLGIDYNLTENIIYSFTSMAGDDAARFELHSGNFTGIKETEPDLKFNMYVADGILNIQSLHQSGGKVAVSDMTGRTIATGRVNPGANTQINIHGKTGVYIVSVLTAKGNINTKILVK